MSASGRELADDHDTKAMVTSLGGHGRQWYEGGGVMVGIDRLQRRHAPLLLHSGTRTHEPAGVHHKGLLASATYAHIGVHPVENCETFVDDIFYSPAEAWERIGERPFLWLSGISVSFFYRTGRLFITVVALSSPSFVCARTCARIWLMTADEGREKMQRRAWDMEKISAPTSLG